jgi:hypothetical protein
MRSRSTSWHLGLVALSCGAIAASSFGMIRVTTSVNRPLGEGNGHQHVRPKIAPRVTETFITVDRVRYRVTCEVTRYIGGAALEDGTVPVWTDVVLRLRRTDGRLITQPVQLPRLTISQGGVSTAIELTPLYQVDDRGGPRPGRELGYSGRGSNEWADDVQLTGQLTIQQRRGVTSTTIRTIPFSLLPLP